MFELQVSNNDVTGGTIPVSWCVNVETLNYLATKGVKNPMVVLVVAPDGPSYNRRKEYRTVVPLKDLMAYVEFRTVGKVKIWGFISEQGKLAKDQYLSRGHDGFVQDLLNSDGTDWGFWFQRNDEKGSVIDVFAEPLSVVVPEECFAPEPSAIEKRWVNWLFQDKCVDQCHFRKRRLFAYTVQPFIMLLNMLMRTVLLLVALLIGARKVSLEYMLHPLTTSPLDSFDMLDDGSIFIDKKYYGWKRYRFLPGMPVIAAAIMGVVLLLSKLHAWMIPLFGLGVIAGLAVLALAGVFGWKAFANYLDRRAKRIAAATPWYMEAEEMDLIVCNGHKKATTVSQLPAKKRTVYLRFMDLKSKVCRPFSA